MARLSIEASTRPSTTSVSQSVISAPFSLMSGPTISLLPVSRPGRAGSAAACKSALGASAPDASGSRVRRRPRSGLPAAGCTATAGPWVARYLSCGNCPSWALLLTFSSGDRSFGAENLRPKMYSSSKRSQSQLACKSCNCRKREHDLTQFRRRSRATDIRRGIFGPE